MFQLIFQTIIIIYIILIIYNILNLQKYNYNGYILFFNGDIKEISNKLRDLIPLHITIKNDFKITEIMNKYNDYIINDNDILTPLNTINKLKHLYIYKNKSLIDDLSINKYIHINGSFFKNSEMLFFPEKTLTIYNNVKTKLHRAYHNYNIIGILDGETIFYLFNPKHKEDILNKDNENIKKWAHKKIIRKGDILFIPTNWYYIQEVKDACIQYHIDADTYFTFIPNFFK